MEVGFTESPLGDGSKWYGLYERPTESSLKVGDDYHGNHSPRDVG